VRVIAATNRGLFNEFRDGRFREDLYYRLNEFAMTIPPLRKRKADIPVLVEHFMAEANAEFGKAVAGISRSALETLSSYYWPGNVRELRNAVRRAILLSDSDFIEAVDTPPAYPFSDRFDPGEGLENGLSLREITRRAAQEVEMEVVKKALTQARNNKTRAAKILKIDRVTLYSKLKSLGLEI
jgi:two-component system response regulator HydG